MSRKGIDVAKWNGIIDWSRVKNAGVQFAILKVINKQCVKEDAFERNYAGATAQGIPVGVYNYSYATTVSKAVSDANIVLSVIKGKDIRCVWLDIEDKTQMNLGMTLIDIIKAYKQVIEGAGYEFGVYTGLSFYNTLIKPYHSFLDCDFWIARYPSGAVVNLAFEPDMSKKPAIIHDLWGWQYTSTGRIDGIPGNVDMSIEYDEMEVISARERQTLRKGSKGAEVTYLQTKLTERGYSLGKIDGDFGSKTDTAVKQFQTDNSLAVDGIVGKNTWDALENSTLKRFSLKEDGEYYLAPNFRIKEFRCKDGSDSILIDVDFVKNKLQKIREHFGAAVTINSAYRTVTYNKQVGGASGSYHLKGRAFDIAVRGKTPLQVAQYAQQLGINGIIQYNTFTHIDSRNSRYWARNDNGKVTVKESF